MNEIEANGMGDALSSTELELPLQDLTWDQMYVALLNLYHQRLLEIQAIKDLMQAENIELEFDIPSDIELAQLALTMMAGQDEEDEDDSVFFD